MLNGETQAIESPSVLQPGHGLYGLSDELSRLKQDCILSGTLTIDGSPYTGEINIWSDSMLFYQYLCLCII